MPALTARCAYCSAPFGRFVNRPITEHVEPLSRGGEDVPENTLRVCDSCNTSKSNLFLLEWVWRRAGLIRGGNGRPLIALERPRRGYPIEAPCAAPSTSPARRPGLWWRLGEVLVERGISQSELSARSGVSFSTVNVIARGKSTRFDLATLGALCAALDCQPGDLLVYVPDPPTLPAKRRTSVDA